MIFPAKLENVTFYLPVRNEYHEIAVNAAKTEFSFESFFTRESINGRKSIKGRGFRFNLAINIDRTTQHTQVLSFINNLADEIAQGGRSIDLYFKPQSQIGVGEDGIEIGPEQIEMLLGYTNQIARHSYNLVFYGELVLPEIAEGAIFFFIFENGDLVIDLNGDNFISELSVG